MLIDDFGGIRIDEEIVFVSFKDAKNFIDTLFDKDVDYNDFLRFRIEIIEYKIGDIDSCLQKWLYNLKGEVIDRQSSLSDSLPEKNSFEYTGKYRVGDLVYIVPKIENKLSPSVKGTYGVIVEIPFTDESSTYKNEFEVSKEYIVYYINEKGLFDHMHVVESALCIPIKKIPNELEFLQIYAKHLKKEKPLPNTLVSQLLKEDIFLKNIKVFDFGIRGTGSVTVDLLDLGSGQTNTLK